MGVYAKMRGIIAVELSAALPEGLLNACAVSSIELWGLERLDACTLRGFVRERDMAELKSICEHCSAQLSKLRQRGGRRSLSFLRRRAVLLAALLITAALLFCSSLFIWEIELVGCESLSRGEILRALEDCGVREGTFRYAFSPELVRSELLLKIPEIAWLTVNVRGSKATVLISERVEKPDIYIESDAADIIASHDGLIRRISVISGKSVVSEGEAVLAGDILVSGAVDSLSREARLVNAKASVLANTWHELTAVCPAESAVKADKRKTSSRFAICLGKKRVNLYFSGRNNIDECDKIIYEYNLGIEGLFLLPLKILREDIYRYELCAESCSRQTEMRSDLQALLEEQIDGEIELKSFSAVERDGMIFISLRAQCLENIARRVPIRQ